MIQKRTVSVIHELRLYRTAIERAHDLADAARPSGHRHMRKPLSTHEQNHHAKVDRYLGRTK